MKAPWSNTNLVAKTPIVTTFLLEYANVGQMWRMWSEHSALGQNVWSWLAVQAALWCWLNYYRVLVPAGQRRFAMWATGIGICLNLGVVLSVVYFRYWAGIP